MTKQHENLNSHLLSIIEEIYDSTLNIGLVEPTLQRIAEFAGARAATLVVKNDDGGLGYSRYAGLTRPFASSYVDFYGQMDPTHSVRHLNVGELQTMAAWQPLEDFRKSRFYNEWAYPQGLQDSAAVLLKKSSERFIYFSLPTAGPVSDQVLQRLTLMVPHLLRAVVIATALRRQTGVLSPVDHMLDELKTAVFLLNRTGQITHTNESGRDILGRRDFLYAERGRLLAADPKLNRILCDAIAASVFGDAAAKSESIALPFVGRDGQRFVGHVLPLTSGRRRETGMAYDATVALFVNKASLDAPAAADLIKKIFKLTPAEARVLLAVVENGNVPETAQNLDVAESTVKTHLGRIFTKTDTKRQSELVKLVAAFASPVRR